MAMPCARRKRAELDEVLRLDQAARRPEPGDDQQLVADVGIGSASAAGAARRTGW